MKIFVHIGPDAQAADRLQRVLDAKRAQLRGKGVLYARSPGARNHSRLFMAISGPVDALRFNRGYAGPDQQAALRAEVAAQLAQEVAAAQPDTLILSAHQLGTSLPSHAERVRLRELLAQLSDDIRIIAQIDDPARMLARRYAAQLLEGRTSSLDLELGLLSASNWWQAALASHGAPDPARGQFPDVQGAVYWLDSAQLCAQWDAVFGDGATQLHSLDLPGLYGESATEHLRILFDIAPSIGKAEPARLPDPPSAAWLTRCRLFNDALMRLLAQRGESLPRRTWRRLLTEIKISGAPLDPGSLSAISARFAKDLHQLAQAHPGLRLPAAPEPKAPWVEAEPDKGFRATQYLMAMGWRISQATAPPKPPAPPAETRHLPSEALAQVIRLGRSGLAPHNRLGDIDEQTAQPAFTPATRQGAYRRVIVGCMKNEAPYILEWLAYHRSIGFDDFLIYTNGCEDGTTELLHRLDQLGLAQHRDNNGWQGKSPQQHALDAALREPVMIGADWIAHIDVDEFINIRCGNGTLDDLFAAAPDATNIAMTWRLFGHGGVTQLHDRPVIEQFETCAPSYCPKPHTAWGFKSLFRNIGAYGKISCHRPNKLMQGFEDKVKWVNGSGRDMTAEASRNGWRNSRKTIGYDLVQLNHYALRSAESFLVKRQRGRALHVDRTIGLNYWIRMDWSGARDISIQRNLPRLRAEMSRLMQDPALRRWHDHGLAWHRAKAAELRATPEFAELYDQALRLKLTDTERVAQSLAHDMES
ncbi:glycosyltransferase family 2 protein [Citreicella sp. C3M06]|uniref:glycosyltransferase family 2 protein n=1 Tax=Citreicella sp. C3M06 TaxID=2841564 RepID=UPI001C0A02DB|nr:glycosyltransferase family 2 protein [Citreicella sp. C3M06]MBU2963382.1 glycosyltransferase family 2 protein [Citreicella sp. C3M06]